MRRFLFFMMVATMLSACGGSDNANGTSGDDEHNAIDSLQAIIDGQQEELDAFMASFAQVQEGLSQMAEAEGRVVAVAGDPGRVNREEQIREDMNYLRTALEQQRERIAQLTQELEASNLNVNSMRTALENLQQQFNVQSQRMQELEIQLNERNITIERQTEEIARLGEENEGQSRTIDEQSRTIDEQDRQLNEAWYVFGTSRELRAQHILEHGEVLTNSNFNRDYFTAVDIRQFTELKLYSRSAEILTSHPEGSYTLTKDNRREYVLRITNAQLFWSVSRYLVIKV